MFNTSTWAMGQAPPRVWSRLVKGQHEWADTHNQTNIFVAGRKRMALFSLLYELWSLLLVQYRRLWRHGNSPNSSRTPLGSAEGFRTAYRRVAGSDAFIVISGWVWAAQGCAACLHKPSLMRILWREISPRKQFLPNVTGHDSRKTIKRSTTNASSCTVNGQPLFKYVACGNSATSARPPQHWSRSAELTDWHT